MHLLLKVHWQEQKQATYPSRVRLCSLSAVRSVSVRSRTLYPVPVLVLGVVVLRLRMPVGAAFVAVCLSLSVVVAGAVGATSSPVSDAQRAEFVEEAKESHEQLLAERAKPAAVAEREASGDAFSGLTAGEAKDTFAATFEGVAQAPAYATDGLVKDGEITQLVGSNTAKVDLDDGGKGLLVSAWPLQVSTDSGAENVDAALRSEGDQLVPEAPLAEYSVAKDLTEGVALTAADVTIAPVGPGVADAEPQRVGDSVLWANAAADTDFVVAPTATGVETFHQVRSQEAPESFALDIGVPTGGRIVRAADLPEALEIQDADGKAVASVSPAVAQDADGVDVPASYTIDNDLHRVTIDVPHRDRDVHYPLLVDPSVSILQYLWDSGAAGNYPGWTYEGTPGVPHTTGNGFFGWGIYGWLASGQYFVSSDAAWYAFRAPGTSTVAAATFKATYYTEAKRSCIAEGILGSAGWDSGMTALTNGTSLSTNPYIICSIWGVNAGFALNERGISSSTKSAGNMAVFQIGTAHEGAWTGTDLAYLNQSTVVLEDNILPATGHGDLTNAGPGSSMTFVGADGGTGVKRISISSPTYASWNGTVDEWHNCGPGAYAPRHGCVQYDPHTVSWGNMPGGHQVIRVRVWDEVGNVVTNDYDVGDGAGPTITASIPGSVRVGTPLSFSATDPSGVVRLEVADWSFTAWTNSVDELFTCCSTSKTVSTNPGNMFLGPNTVHVRATDRWGNATTIPYTFTLLDTPGSPATIDSPDGDTDSTADVDDGDDSGPQGCYDTTVADCDPETDDSSAPRAHLYRTRMYGISGEFDPLDPLTYVPPSAPGKFAELVAPDTSDRGIRSMRKIVAFDVAGKLAEEFTKPFRTSSSDIAYEGTFDYYQHSEREERNRMDRWLKLVTPRPRFTPLISFGHIASGGFFDRMKAIKSLPGFLQDTYRRAANPLPTVNEYRASITRFLDMYRGNFIDPAITDKTAATDPCTWNYTAWNEPNNGYQPTHVFETAPAGPTSSGLFGWQHFEASGSGPGTAVRAGSTTPSHFGGAMAAAYWKTLKALLPSYCEGKGVPFTGQVLAGDFEARKVWSWVINPDKPALNHWNNSYWRWMPASAKQWAYHYYADVNKVGTADTTSGFSSLRSFYRAFRHRDNLNLWLTEGGPIFKKSDTDDARIDSAKRFFRDLPLQSTLWEHIAGLYLYSWRGDDNWDSGIYARQTAGAVAHPELPEGKWNNGELRPGYFAAFKGIVRDGDDD